MISCTIHVHTNIIKDFYVQYTVPSINVVSYIPALHIWMILPSWKSIILTMNITPTLQYKLFINMFKNYK